MTYAIEVDDRGLQALSFLVDAALKGKGLEAHAAAGLVLQAIETAVRESHAGGLAAGNGHASDVTAAR